MIFLFTKENKPKKDSDQIDWKNHNKVVGSFTGKHE